MTTVSLPPHTAFAGHHILASGSLADVALAVKHAPPSSPSAPC